MDIHDTLGNELIDFLTNYDMLGRRQYQISDVQEKVADYLTGQSVAGIRAARTELFNYKIIEKLQETEEFTEFLCEPKLIATAKYKIREYPFSFKALATSRIMFILSVCLNVFNRSLERSVLSS